MTPVPPSSRRARLAHPATEAPGAESPASAAAGAGPAAALGPADSSFVAAGSVGGPAAGRPSTPAAGAGGGASLLAARASSSPIREPLAGADRALLAAYRFDDELHASLRARVKSGALTPSSSLYRGTIEAPRPGDVAALPPAGSAEEARLPARGERALADGKVAVVVLAGGMATRFQGAVGRALGEPVVKGTVDVVDGKSFLELKLADARAAGARFGKPIPFCIMGSFATLPGPHGIERHLQDRGLLGDDVRLFAQSISLRTTPGGDVFGAGGGALPADSYTTPGHGDFFRAVRESGVLDELRAQGVETVLFSNVDNLGATVDPRIVGKLLEERDAHGTAMLAEVVERAPDDGAKAGAVVRADGKLRILEGFRIPDHVAASVELPDIAINSFAFDANKLAQDIPLDVHAVRKKVGGKDAIQFETVTCEATGAVDAAGKPLLPLSVLRVPREGGPGRFFEGRFYPVKTPEDLDRVRSLLAASPSARAPSRAERLDRLDAALDARFGPSELGRRYFSSPGRINLIGEHVDYRDGLALPAAVDKGIVLATQPRDGDVIEIVSLDDEAPVRFSRTNPSLDGDAGWGRYAKAVVRVLAERGVEVPGLAGALQSTLPAGGGMSSSSALCVALASAFAAAAGKPLAGRDLVEVAQRAEHLVGVRCGNLDQAAIVNGVRDHAILLDCRTLDVKPVALDLHDHVLVVGDTKKARGLVDSAYNARRAECEEAVARLAKATGRDLRSLRDVTSAELEKHAAALPGTLLARARHVVGEIERVRRFVAELAAGADPAKLGALLDESHASLRDRFAVSCAELDAMVESARAHGAAGARMMGGGFGGCTLSLVKKADVEAFIDAVGKDHRARTGLEPSFTVVTPGDGAREIPRIEVHNPISAAECPDPSVVRAGNDFFVANTEPQPGSYRHGEAAYPLRKAVNGDFDHLVDVGHIFAKGEAPDWLCSDPWAPELHHDPEMGYVVTFTGRNAGGKLCIGMAFAERPEGPYRERSPGPFLVHPEIGVIDSTIFYDPDTKKRVMLWKEDWNDRPGEKKTTPILMRELVMTDEGPVLAGDVKKTIENDLPFEGELVEGASVIKRGGFFYMFYSAGPYYNGDYKTSVARARSLEGPWEKLGENAMPNDEHWEGRGHGYVARDAHGNDFFVCHGYPKGDYKKRVMLMFPIHWENGWPVIDTQE